MKDFAVFASRPVRGALLIVLMAWLVGCATTSMPIEPRTEHFRAASERVLRVTQASLLERGFVILYGDHALGRLRAEYPTRPPLSLQAQVSAAGGQGTLLSLSARRGSQSLAPYELDALMGAIRARLGEGVVSGQR